MNKMGKSVYVELLFVCTFIVWYVQPHRFICRMNEFDLGREGMSIGSVDLCRTIVVVVALY